MRESDDAARGRRGGTASGRRGAPGCETSATSRGSARSALVAQVRRLARSVRRRSDVLEPSGTVDSVARVRIEDLARQMERLETRLNLILAAIVGTLVVDILKAFVR